MPHTRTRKTNDSHGHQKFNFYRKNSRSFVTFCWCFHGPPTLIKLVLLPIMQSLQYFSAIIQKRTELAKPPLALKCIAKELLF